VSKGDAKKAVGVFEKHGQEAYVIGRIIRERKVEVVKDGVSFVL
jgi:selenophosphate synthetase-related protein